MTRKANQPFVRNAWYIAAWSEEIESGLLARTIMNQPIVIYRDADGNVGALEDRCCHGRTFDSWFSYRRGAAVRLSRSDL